ncbi:MAG: S9 family peptidase [Xanthomonadales bacterium]|nr:S9 family peptidase [Xanthomonadales bacterium]
MMHILFAEWSRLARWALLLAALHLGTLLFLGRMVDLGQQPLAVHWAFCASYALIGLLLGVFQCSGYARPSHWLVLLHRPLPIRKIAVPVFAGGALVLVCSIALPVLLAALWQSSMTARVVDVRHELLALAALNVSLCGYAAGSFAVIAPRRYAAVGLVLLFWMIQARATGPAALLVQLIIVAWAFALLATVFKPDRDAPPRFAAVLALPTAMGVYFVVLVGFAVLESFWIAWGQHPKSGTPPPLGYEAMQQADPAERMLAALRESSHPDARLLAEQVRLSTPVTLGLQISRPPQWHELTNVAPMEFDDARTGMRFVFSHDDGLYHGYRLGNGAAAAVLQPDSPFSLPPLAIGRLPGMPAADRLFIAGSDLFHYDSRSGALRRRVALPHGESLLSLAMAGDAVIVRTDAALYALDLRPFFEHDRMFAPRARLPMSGEPGDVGAVDLIELVDGYLVVTTLGARSDDPAGADGRQIAQRLGFDGTVEEVGHRALQADFGWLFRYRAYWLSPALFECRRAAEQWAAQPDPHDRTTPAPIPATAHALALLLSAVSLLATLGRTQVGRMSRTGRALWLVASAAFGLPMMVAFALIHRLDHASASRRWLGRWVTAALLACVSTQVSAQPRDAFLAAPTVSHVTIAPDATSVAWIATEDARRSVWLQDLASGHRQRLMAHTAAGRLEFSTDARWLMLASDDRLFALATRGQGGSGIVATLGSERNFERVDPSVGAAVLITSEQRVGDTRRWRLSRLTVTGDEESLYESASRIAGFALDAHGRPAWIELVESAHLGVHAASSSTPAVMRCASVHRCTPIHADDRGVTLHTDRMEGDPAGLGRIVRWDGIGEPQVLLRDPAGEADIEFISADPTGRPRLAGCTSTGPRLLAADSRDRAAVDALTALLPGYVLRPQISRSLWLVEARSTALPFPRWFLFDPVSHDIKLFIEGGAQREGRQANAVRWTASDGMTLHGFLTLADEGVRAPLVVLAHGGPWSHWQSQYSMLTQFMVSRGVSVFQPNHRGSTGHGHAYKAAARGDFGGNGRVQHDIDEGVDALLARGIGKPGQAAIVGASFGGYAALLGATFSPQRYQAALAFVPPTDFASTIKHVLRTPESLALERHTPMSEWFRQHDLDVTDAGSMRRLHANSPLSHVANLSRPVIIVAAGEDRRVAVTGIIEYAARASLAGKPVTVVIDDNAGHRMDGKVSREAQLFLIELMLHQTLGVDAPAPLQGAVQAYLAEHVRCCGAEPLAGMTITR